MSYSKAQCEGLQFKQLIGILLAPVLDGKPLSEEEMLVYLKTKDNLTRKGKLETEFETQCANNRHGT
jgi:hypothetical protein